MRMEGESHDKEVAYIYECTKIDTLFMTKMAGKWPKTLFMTKTAEKPYPLGPYTPI